MYTYLYVVYMLVYCVHVGVLFTCWCVVNMLVCCVHVCVVQVEEFQSVRERLSAQMAEDASFIRSWIIRAEDARLMENWYNHALNTFIIVRFRDAFPVISVFVGLYLPRLSKLLGARNTKPMVRLRTESVEFVIFNPSMLYWYSFTYQIGTHTFNF